MSNPISDEWSDILAISSIGFHFPSPSDDDFIVTVDAIKNPASTTPVTQSLSKYAQTKEWIGAEQFLTNQVSVSCNSNLKPISKTSDTGLVPPKTIRLVLKGNKEAVTTRYPDVALGFFDQNPSQWN